jgi:hypothetical protein
MPQRLRAGHGGGEDLLRVVAGVVPEGVDVEVVGGEPLVVADELRAAIVYWRV